MTTFIDILVKYGSCNNVVRIIIDSNFSESDNDSDGMEEILTLLIKDKQNIPRIRCKRYVEDVVSRYTNRQFKSHFRLNRNTFYFILDLIGPILEKSVNTGRRTISSEKQLLLALWIMVTPNSYRCVSDRFDVGKATVWRSVRKVVNALYSLLEAFIKWLTREEATKTFNVVQNKYGFPKVIGAVDGTYIRIAAPKIHSEAYINRKGYHSMQLQVICDSDLKFIHCYTGQVGSVHDARVFRLSGMYNFLNGNYFYENSHILSDAAYSIDSCVMVPFKDNGHLTESQINFNTYHSKVRIMIERAIGLFKARFRSLLDRLLMTRTDLIPKYIIASCILHNICVLQNDFIEIPIIVNEPQHIPYNDINNIERKNQGIENETQLCIN